LSFFYLSRLYINAEQDDWFRFYGEAIDALSYWLRGIEVNRFDDLNLLADLDLWHSGCDAIHRQQRC
jgi:hypothetical protein